MNRQEDLLRQIIRIAKSGRDYFAAVYPSVIDADMRSAFVYMSEIKERLIADIEPWIPAIQEDVSDHVSPAALVEKMYRDARAAFRTSEPAASAKALTVAEEQLSRLVERTFEVTTDARLKDALKAHYPQLLVCVEAMRRLRARMAA
jgi:hypothetical protein